MNVKKVVHFNLIFEHVVAQILSGAEVFTLGNVSGFFDAIFGMSTLKNTQFVQVWQMKANFTELVLKY